MKRCLSLSLLAVVAVGIAGSATPATAQSTSDKWNGFVAPYLMGAAMSGETTVRGVGIDIDASASDVFSTCSSVRWGSRWPGRAIGDSAPT